MGYATLTQVKQAMSLGVADRVDDANITIALSAAEQMVTDYCGRSFTNAGTAVRSFQTTDDDCAYIDDAVSITTVETTNDGVTWVAWDSADWEARPLNGLLNGSAWPYTEIRAIRNYEFPELDEQADLRVTATWGWASVPAAIEQATIQQTLRLWGRFSSSLGYAGGPETGLIRVGKTIDGDVAQLLAPYRRFTAWGLA